MRRLPNVSAADLKALKLSELLKIREIADQHFLAEMKKRTDKMKRTGSLEPETIPLQNANNLQSLVQTEMARRAEQERTSRAK